MNEEKADVSADGMPGYKRKADDQIHSTIGRYRNPEGGNDSASVTQKQIEGHQS